jgi:hypothetical protein
LYPLKQPTLLHMTSPYLLLLGYSTIISLNYLSFWKTILQATFPTHSRQYSHCYCYFLVSRVS